MRRPARGLTPAARTIQACRRPQARGPPPRKRQRLERQAPVHSVQVTAESEPAVMALGEALNLSGRGACLALQTRALLVGDEVILWLNFARPRPPVPATARIVWAADGEERPRYGVEWTHGGPQRSWIGWAAGS